MADKNICEVSQLDSMTENTNVLVEENGTLNKLNLYDKINPLTMNVENLSTTLDSLISDLSSVSTQVNKLNLDKSNLTVSADTILTNGVYRVISSKPVNSITDGVLVSFAAVENNVVLQLLVSYNCTYVGVRCYWYAATGWSSWRSLI